MSNKPDLPWIPLPRTAPDAAAEWVKGFSIGDVAVDKPFILAPMSGVTDRAFRRTVQIASRSTVGLLVTEFICVEGLTADNIQARTRIAFDKKVKRPLAVQIFGADIDLMVRASKIVQDCGADIVDINCGCPAPKVVRRGGGAELMRQGDRLARMIEACVAAVEIPVTVKMRSGWDTNSVNVREVSRQAESAGAAMIAIHGRTRKQLYSGEPDWEIIAQVAQDVAVPVVGSGDIASAQGAVAQLQQSGCAGVMIGRAAVMNPWIFGQIDDMVAGRIPLEPSSDERSRVIIEFAEMMAAYIPPKAISGRLKQLLARLTKGIEGGHLLRERALRARSTQEVLGWVQGFFAAQVDGTLPAWIDKAHAARSELIRVPRGVKRRRRAA